MFKKKNETKLVWTDTALFGFSKQVNKDYYKDLLFRVADIAQNDTPFYQGSAVYIHHKKPLNLKLICYYKVSMFITKGIGTADIHDFFHKKLQLTDNKMRTWAVNKEISEAILTRSDISDLINNLKQEIDRINGKFIINDKYIKALVPNIKDVKESLIEAQKQGLPLLINQKPQN